VPYTYVRGALDAAASRQDLSGQRVTKAMRLGIPHAPLREYSLVRFPDPAPGGPTAAGILAEFRAIV